MTKSISFVVLAAAGALTILPATAFAETDQAAHQAMEAAATPLKLSAGVMIYGPNNYRIARVYRVTADGNPQVILDSRLITIPASSLSEVGGKVTTSLSKKDVSVIK